MSDGEKEKHYRLNHFSDNETFNYNSTFATSVITKEWLTDKMLYLKNLF